MRTQTMIQTQKRQRAALPHTALPRRGPARPAGRQNAIEYREEYIDGDGDDETKLEEIQREQAGGVTGAESQKDQGRN